MHMHMHTHTDITHLSFWACDDGTSNGPGGGRWVGKESHSAIRPFSYHPPPFHCDRAIAEESQIGESGRSDNFFFSPIEECHRKAEAGRGTDAGVSSASALIEGLLSDAADPFLLPSGAPRSAAPA